MIEIPRIIEAQGRGNVCAYLDLAGTFDTERACAEGVKLDDLLVSQPESVDSALEIADTLLRTGSIGILVVDLGNAPVHFQRVRGLFNTAAKTTTFTVVAAVVIT